jgi:hypothetical protein
VLVQEVVRRQGAAADRVVPATVVGQIEPLHDLVDHRRHELALAGDVVVQRHGLDAQRLAELAHAQGVQPVLVSKRNRPLEHALSRERLAGSGSRRHGS